VFKQIDRDTPLWFPPSDVRRVIIRILRRSNYFLFIAQLHAVILQLGISRSQKRLHFLYVNYADKK
jgi:hypothetical protein